jgi:hypothetical protein
MRRSVYLQAMGVDTYVSRCQLPGAAETRRLAIVRAVRAPLAQTGVGQLAETAPARQPLSPAGLTRIETVKAAPAPAVAAVRPGAGNLPSRFSLAAISCGGWLWLEELENTPLAPEQLQLVQAMAEALGTVASHGAGHEDNSSGGRLPARAVTTQFDWPMHTNQQLDQGEEAARASVAAFIQRKLEQPGCNGLVLLGRKCEARVPLGQLACARLARIASSAEMLRSPLLKKQAWRDLRLLLQTL